MAIWYAPPLPQQTQKHVPAVTATNPVITDRSRLIYDALNKLWIVQYPHPQQRERCVTPATATSLELLAIDSGVGIDAKKIYPTVMHSRSETGIGAELSALLKSFLRADVGSGTDAKAIYPTVVHSRAEMGHGGELSSILAALLRAETGHGAELSALIAAYLSAETGSGVDAKKANPTAVHLRAEEGYSIESVLSFLKQAVESGAGVDLSALKWLGQDVELILYIRSYRDLKVYTSEV